MRPRFFTPRNLILILVAVTIFVGLSTWIKAGMPLPGAGIASTAGKIAFVSDRGGNPDIWMMNGDGSDPVPITQNPTREDQPAWSEGGKELAFVGAKSETDSPQIYIADATTGRNAVAITRTSGAKSHPFWEGNQEVNFLDAGKLASYDTSGQETHAIFPEADHKRAVAALFPRGGLERAYQIGEHTYLLIMNAEDGQLLMGYQFDHDHPNDVVLQLLGQGEKIQVATIKSGGFVAAFENGAPLAEPQILLNAQRVQALSVQANTDENQVPLVNATPQKGVNVVALFDNNTAVKNGIRLPFAVKEVQTSADASTLVFVPQPNPKNPEQKGIIVAKTTEGALAPVTNREAAHVSLSPDGTQIAFQSGEDIYTVPVAGGEVKNVTQGKGNNSYPVWSPTLPEAKK